MRKVCIALDNCSTSQKLAEAGYTFAREINAQVALIHVLDDRAVYDVGLIDIIEHQDMEYYRQDAIITQIHSEMMQQLNKTAAHLGELVIRKEIAVGTTYEEILKFAVSWQADIIVINRSSKQYFDTHKMSSTAHKLIQHSTLPLLIFPTNN